MRTKKQITAAALSAATAVLMSGPVMAAFEDPSTAAWGGWSRTDTESLYVHWDVFETSGGKQ